MQIVRAWRDSLLLFLPRNARPFVLVTLKTAINIYIFVVAVLLVSFLVVSLLIMTFSASFSYLSVPVYSFISFITLLAVRPSVRRKGWHYFWFYRFYFFYLLVYAFLSLGLVALLLYLVSNKLMYTILFFLFNPYILYIFSSLFLLDSSLSLYSAAESILNGGKMLICTMPLTATILLLMSLFFLPIESAIIGNYRIILAGLLQVLLYPFIISYCGNIYIKNLYEHSDFYIKGVSYD